MPLLAATAVVAAQDGRNGSWVGPTAHAISPLAQPPSPTNYTTSTIYTTLVYTVTSCAPTITLCPEQGTVVTKTISLFTTVCPVSTPVDLLPLPEPTPTTFAASTVETIISTVTYCPPGAPDCDTGSETSAVSTYTTTYPIVGPTAAHHIPGPQGTGALGPNNPMQPKGNVTLPHLPKVSTVSGATTLASRTLLVFLGLAAGAATAYIHI